MSRVVERGPSVAVNRQKLKLLYLMRMLEDETDSEKGLSMAQILGRLESYGIDAERKSVYRDIEALREFGLDVRSRRREAVEYFLASRDFDLPELMLLIDAVQSSRFLTKRRSDALVRSVKRLASAPQRVLLDKRLHVEGRIKSQNESVFRNVDRIQEALAQRRKVSFRYFRYNAAKKKILRRDGQRYVETPVRLVYADGFYYLVAYNEKHDSFPHYRVDRMDGLEVLGEPACRNERVAAYGASEVQSYAFGMYNGEDVSVTLLVDDEAMDAVIDRFGRDVSAVSTGDGAAHVHVSVCKSPVFFGWLAQFGTRVQVEKPASLAREYRAYLTAIVESYKAG